MSRIFEELKEVADRDEVFELYRRIWELSEESLEGLSKRELLMVMVRVMENRVFKERKLEEKEKK